MNLSPVNSSRGAPMGRPEQHNHSASGLTFELEWVPFIDGGYDAGGAYWGAPDNLYCAQADDEADGVCFFLRAASREEAMNSVVKPIYLNCTFEPENGSLIKQAIKFLEDYADGEEETELSDDAQLEADDLKAILEEKGLT